MQQTRRRSARAPRPDPWRRIDAAQTWDDLVLPHAARAQLQSVSALLSERYWTGSAAPGDSGRRGVLLLFAGSVGTGKTMGAQVLAHEMGVPILSADLESVYAGGRGAAERVTARMFAHAQRLGAVLELDRADFMLSSAVASERPMSIRVAAADLRELLERCESHPGVVVFPTTRTREIDEAVRGRVDATIEFPFPETPARAAIWQRSLAPGAAVSPAEIADLAGSFQLPGQAIAACCAAAAQAAHSDGVPVGLAHIAHALEQEYATRLVSDTTRTALERLHGRAGGPGPGPAEIGPSAFAGNGAGAGAASMAQPEQSPPVAEAQPGPLVAEAQPGPLVAEAEPDPPVAEAEPAPAPAAPTAAEPVVGEEPASGAALDSTEAPTQSHEIVAPAVAEVVATPAEAESVATPTEPEPGDELAPPAHPPQAAAPEPLDSGAAAIDDAAADNLVRAMASSATAATPTAPPEPRRRRRWVTAARRLIPVALIGIISAAVLGLAAANQSKPSATPPAPDQLARTREVSFFYPGTWHLQSAPRIRGLSLRDAVAVSSSASPAGRLVIGTSPTRSDNPLPEQFIATTITGTPPQKLVTLGKHQFFRVIDPRLTLGAASQSVYALSSAAGPIIAVCQTASQAFAASCEHVLSTLQVATHASVPAARTAHSAPAAAKPSRAYAGALSAILSRLNRERGAAAHDLAAARTSKPEAKAAGLLAGLHAQASGEIAGLRAGPAAAANASLATALRNLADAYGTLGRAALHNDSHGYRVGQSDIAQASSALSAALAKLAALGYAVR